MARASACLTRRAALSGLLALGACALPGDVGPGAAAPRTARIHVAGRDWHTDIVLPVATLRGGLARLAETFPGATHLAIGFGDRAYLLRREVDVFDMLAALLPGPGALLVTGLTQPPALAFGADHVVALPVSESGRAGAEDFVWRSFATGGDGRAEAIADGPYGGSRFYASTLVYEASTTCNTWTAQALRAAGLPVTATGVLFADQVMAQARRIAGL